MIVHIKHVTTSMTVCISDCSPTLICSVMLCVMLFVHVDGECEHIEHAKSVLSEEATRYQTEYKEKLDTNEEISDLAFLYEGVEVIVGMTENSMAVTTWTVLLSYSYLFTEKTDFYHNYQRFMALMRYPRNVFEQQVILLILQYLFFAKYTAGKLSLCFVVRITS